MAFSKWLAAVGRDTRQLLMWAIAALLLTAGVTITLFNHFYESTSVSAGAAVSGAERARMEAVVRDYLLHHPEIIPEALRNLQDRQVGEMIQANREAIETPFEGAWAGAKNGDVVLVEFFDYACPYCKASVADVRRLLAEDKGLKVVWRDFPVLGDDSRQAAMASLSAARQGKYAAFYDSMFQSGRPDRANVVNAVRTAGMDEMRTGRDMNAPAFNTEIQNNLELGRMLGLNGTPSYVIGDQILNGAVGYDALKAAVAKAREAKRRQAAS